MEKVSAPTARKIFMTRARPSDSKPRASTDLLRDLGPSDVAAEQPFDADAGNEPVRQIGLAALFHRQDVGRIAEEDLEPVEIDEPFAEPQRELLAVAEHLEAADVGAALDRFDDDALGSQRQRVRPAEDEAAARVGRFDPGVFELEMPAAQLDSSAG